MQLGPPPTDAPPPTPIRFPQWNPSLSQDTDPAARGSSSPPQDGCSDSSLVHLLQAIHRPTDLDESHFAALGVHVHSDAPPEDLLPDPSYLPPAVGWDGLTIDQARERDPTFRRPLSNGNDSPEARIYVERRNELSIPNQAAFRVIRRLKAEPGKPPVRLGNCYEFFKQMELMAGYWDDTSLPPYSDGDDEAGQKDVNAPASPPSPTAQAGSGVVSGSPESNTRSLSASDKPPQTPMRVTYRRQAGSDMPPEHRHNLLAAFVKLVSYDFGCNVGPSRIEPRLHLLEPPPPPLPSSSSSSSSSSSTKKTGRPAPPPLPRRASYFPSGCVFVHRIPTTREAARAGVVEGPVAVVTSRSTTSFETAADERLDLGRELVAALATAQLRARQNGDDAGPCGEGRFRFGEGRWWATVRRWGGGEGGPIGREVETAAAAAAASAAKTAKTANAIANATAAAAAAESLSSSGSSSPSPSSSSARASAAAVDGKSSSAGATPATPLSPLSPPPPLSSSSSSSSSRPPTLPVRGQPASKKQRKTPSIYDHYRSVRPPAANWDRKARYEAIGRARAPGCSHDDVFLLTSLFHHFCIVRVRVPDRLLEVLDGRVSDGVGGGEEEEGAKGKGKEKGRGKGDAGGGRSWGKLEVWRSRWFDLFLVDERLEAMRELWGVMGWLMRQQEEGGGEGRRRPRLQQRQHDGEQGPAPANKDVVMEDA